MLGVVVSEADVASVTIREQLLDLADWRSVSDPERPASAGGGEYYRTDGVELRCFDDLHLHLDGAAEAFDDPDCLVFASRHAGETGPLLTAHFTGNIGPAEFGGAGGDLALACPNAHAAVLDALDRFAPSAYEVGMECTHHGPSAVGAPSMFVEVGSGPAQWEDAEAARAVARSILALEGVAPDSERAVVGFGGGHYAPRFDRIRRETDWAIGHVAADWALDSVADLGESTIRQCFDRSGTELAVIDGEYPAVAELITDLGYRLVSETWLRETDTVPLDLVDRAEHRLCSIDDGLRFGRARGGLVVTDLDPALVADASGIDLERTRAVVADHAVAFETTDGGSRVEGRIALPSESARSALLDDLLAILAERFDRIERDDEAIVAVEQAFDPDRARTLGVPAGPAFGRLTDGQSVEVDGTAVTPADVHVERRVTYSV